MAPAPLAPHVARAVARGAGRPAPPTRPSALQPHSPGAVQPRTAHHGPLLHAGGPRGAGAAPAPGIRSAGPAEVGQPFLGTALAIGATAVFRRWTREPETFKNRQAAHWMSEHATYLASAMHRVQAGTMAFNALMGTGNPFIWTYDLQGELWAMDGTVGDPKHSQCSNNRRLLSAGTGEWNPTTGKLEIANVTGHYHASYESMYAARTAFAKAGWPVVMVTHSLASAPRGFAWQAAWWLGLEEFFE